MGFVLKIVIEYLKEFRKLRNGYHFATDKIDIKNEMLPKY